MKTMAIYVGSLMAVSTVEEWKTPLYMLVDLVITKSEEEAVFPMDLTVKNVRAYQPLQPYKGQ